MEHETGPGFDRAIARGRNRRMPRVDDDDGALADDFDLASTHDHTGGLIDADADERPMIEDGADQPVAPLPLQEMLIEDDIRREPEPVCRDRSAGGDVFQIGVARDHHFRQDCRACARAADDHACFISRADQFVEPGAELFPS